jgi:hypothetical protein
MFFNFRGLLLGLFLLGLLLALLVNAGKPTQPKGLEAPPEQFSAARAFKTLKYLLGDETPHPLGSEANERVRDRIVEQLKSLGYEPETTRVEMNTMGDEGPIVVENIHCLIPGTTQGPAVMLAAHYDSAPEGPGAADDGASVAAIIEIARILKRETPLRNPIVLLITDGEERGLHGARAFVMTTLARQVAAVVNLEARGTCGRSLMFETGAENAWLISAYAAAVPSPDTSSFYNDIYRRLPNSTDFAVFKSSGMTGYNFAFIGNKEFYHTANDNLANLDHGSLQHHGDNALATIRSLVAADLRNPPPGNAVYTDILSLFVVHWPERWTLPLTILAILPLAAVIFDLLRKKTLSPRSLFSGLALSPLIVILPVLLGSVMMWLLSLLPVSPQFWIAAPWCKRILLWSETVVAVVVLTILCNRKSGGCGPAHGSGGRFSVCSLASCSHRPAIFFCYR